MSSLYDIKNRFYELATRDDLEEEEKNELAQILCNELTAKSANIIGFVRNLETDIDAIDAEVNRLQEMKKATKNKLDRFMQYVETNMSSLGVEEISTPIGKLFFRKSPASVEIINEEEIPEEYIRIKTERSVDKKAILDAYKNDGELVSGTRIVTDKYKLNIK